MAATTKSFRIGDVGSKLGLTVIDCDTSAAIDLSTATLIEIVYRKPSGTLVRVTASFADFGGATGDGTDGKIMYVTPNSSFFDETGYWEYSAYVTFATGAYSTQPVQFHVDRGVSP